MTMKMIKSTSRMSIMGVTFISDILLPEPPIDIAIALARPFSQIPGKHPREPRYWPC
jgi:hypothetical protein